MWPWLQGCRFRQRRREASHNCFSCENRSAPRPRGASPLAVVSRGGKEGGRGAVGGRGWGRGRYFSPSRSYCLSKTLVPSIPTPNKNKMKRMNTLLPLPPQTSSAGLKRSKLGWPHLWQEQTTEEGEAVASPGTFQVKASPRGTANGVP